MGFPFVMRIIMMIMITVKILTMMMIVPGIDGVVQNMAVYR